MHRLKYLLVIPFVFLLSRCAAVSKELGYSKAQWNALPPAQQKQLQQQYQRVRTSQRKPSKVSGSTLLVTFKGGMAKFPPHFTYSSFHPVSARIKSGQCKTLALVSKKSGQRTKLKVCSTGVSLDIDPSRHEWSKVAGSIMIMGNPAWYRGYMYHDIHTSGYASLRHVNLHVRSQ